MWWLPGGGINLRDSRVPVLLPNPEPWPPEPEPCFELPRERSSTFQMHLGPDESSGGSALCSAALHEWKPVSDSPPGSVGGWHTCDERRHGGAGHAIYATIRSSHFLQRATESQWGGLGRGSQGLTGYRSCVWVETGLKRSKMEAEDTERERWSQRDTALGPGGSSWGSEKLFGSALTWR